MATDVNSAVGQSENAHSKLAEYFSDLHKFANDTTGTIPPPDASTLSEALDYSELHRMTSSRISDSASFENGAAIENINTMVAIGREFALRSKGKLNYYNDAKSEYLQESNYYSTMKVFYSNMLNGIYLEGKTS